MSKPTKQYGLIDPKTSKPISRPSIFNESSGSDDDTDRPTGINTLKKKERLAQQKILAEDPTVYQYDELYDEIQEKRNSSKLARKDLDRKPKYINKLLETAERRKRENERRIERQVQKERELEGDTYKDKESFVTNAYKKKLEEMKELEEKEKREDYLEAIGDVKKQGDLSGFYRHLYAQQVNYEEENEKKIKKDVTNDGGDTKNDDDTNNDDAKNNDDTPKETNKDGEPSKDRKRRYRKRERSSSDSEPTEDIKLEHLPSNLDADSDFEIDSESESEVEAKPIVETVETPVEAEEKTQESNDEVVKTEAVTTEVVETEKKVKVDIWKKRTVGDVFDQAVKRYYERKAARLAGTA